jgi:hypothetical protein
MAIIILYSRPDMSRGGIFTASSFDQDEALLGAAGLIRELGDEDVSGDSVLRSAVDERGEYFRLVGYKRNPDDQSPGAATEWWDVRAQLEPDGQAARMIARDTLTGSLVLEGSFLSPVGKVTGYERFHGYTEDGSTLAPAFTAQQGDWDSSALVEASGAQLHSLLAAGSDRIFGSDLDDTIESAGGIDEITGNLGADRFLIARGQSSKWLRKETPSAGLLIETRNKNSGSKKTKLSYAYDPDVDVITDFQKNLDTLLLQGPVSRYSYADNGESTLVFGGDSRRNLVAVIVGITGLDRSDFSSWS